MSNFADWNCDHIDDARVILITDVPIECKSMGYSEISETSFFEKFIDHGGTSMVWSANLPFEAILSKVFRPIRITGFT